MNHRNELKMNNGNELEMNPKNEPEMNKEVEMNQPSPNTKTTTIQELQQQNNQLNHKLTKIQDLLTTIEKDYNNAITLDQNSRIILGIIDKIRNIIKEDK